MSEVSHDAPGRRSSPGRALAALGIALVVLGLLVVLSAPELLRVPGRAGQLLLLVLAPGLPGLALLGVVLVRRRKQDAGRPARG